MKLSTQRSALYMCGIQIFLHSASDAVCWLHICVFYFVFTETIQHCIWIGSVIVTAAMHTHTHTGAQNVWIKYLNAIRAVVFGHGGREQCRWDTVSWLTRECKKYSGISAAFFPFFFIIRCWRNLLISLHKKYNSIIIELAMTRANQSAHNFER